MAQLVEFTYDGYQKAITAKENCIVSYTLVGGGGGGGGPDTYSGYPGLVGRVENGTILMNKGDTIYVAVGQGGRGGGAQGTSRPGGVGGNGLNGFSGGTGGRSGGYGSSGAGGGGGAATVLSYNADGSNPIAIAPGGGGGGGGGDHGNGRLYSLDPYGDTATYVLKYISNAATNGAYCSFLNTYGVWNNIEHNVYEVYFPESGNYTFRLSADNFGYLWLDNGTVNGNNDFIGQTPGTGANDFNQYYDFSHYVPAGWHTVDMYARNWGGPAAVAAAIMSPSDSKNYMWTTRYAYNPLSSTKDIGRGGHGQDYPGDGGGAGGGGGGYKGGRGGPIRSGDAGSYTGSTGYSYNINPSSVTVGSPSLYGIGGLGVARPTGGLAGGDGYAAFEVLQSDINIRQTITRWFGFFSSRSTVVVWRKVTGAFKRKSYTFFGLRLVFWEKIPAIYIRQNGEWKKVYGDDTVTYYSTNSSYSTTTGPYPG